MTLDHRVRERLLAIEALLRETEHWQDSAPDSRAFASEQPFCLDNAHPVRERLLAELVLLDALFAGGEA